MEPVDIGWAAGIIDGEGCILLSRNKKRGCFTLRVHVVNTDPYMLIKLKKLFGGSIHESNAKTDLPHWKFKWVWVVVSKDAEIALETLIPFLVTKREQAELAITFRLLKRRRGGRKHTFSKINSELLEKQEHIFHGLRALKEKYYGFPVA